MDENPYRAPQVELLALPASQWPGVLKRLKTVGFYVLLVSAAVNSVGLLYLVYRTWF